MNFSKPLKIVTFILICAFVITSGFAISSVQSVYNTYAETNEQIKREDPELNDDGQEASVYGLVTSLSLAIDSGDGKVWATVKNDFTLFSETVVVIVQLYSSDTYAESYTEMSLVCMNSIADLDIGQTISTEAETGGVEKFWLARMRYKIGDDVWQSRQTGACRISGSGEFLGYI